jgi:hypothetical protein
MLVKQKIKKIKLILSILYLSYWQRATGNGQRATGNGQLESLIPRKIFFFVKRLGVLCGSKWFVGAGYPAHFIKPLREVNSRLRV